MANTNPYIVKAPNQDTTSRVLTNDYQAFTDAATIALLPTAYHTVVNLTQLSANTTITVDTSTATFGIGAELIILMTGDATSPINTYTVTFSTGFSTNTGTLTIAGFKAAKASFTFTGTTWIGTGSVQS